MGNTTIQNLLQNAALQIQSENPEVDAEWLLSSALRVDRTYLHTWPERIPNPDAIQRFEESVKRRVAGEPVAYILGHQPFWSLDLKVNSNVLIPRPETELLVEWALRYLPVDQPARVLDLGTGSGAIALALARERPNLHVVGVDQSREALEIARENVRRNHLPETQFTWIHSHWFEGLQVQRERPPAENASKASETNPCFQVIVSNPPYVAKADPHLSQGDLRFEPQTALVGGPEGMDCFEVIVENAPLYLCEKGVLLLEHGADQGKKMRSLLKQRGFVEVKTVQDHGGLDRMSLGKN